MLDLVVPGAVFEERFEALRRAGAGAMGTIFRARDRRAGGWVAVKILREVVRRLDAPKDE